MRRAAILFLLAAAPALARGPDGMLWIVETPNDGLPAIVAPGGSFDAVVTEEAALALSGETAPVPLEIEWEQLPGERRKARCTIPPDTKPGRYAIEAMIGDRTDRNERSVYIGGPFPDTYTIGHITDTHIGRVMKGRFPEATMRDILRTFNETNLAFVLVTGDITENGNPDQFRAFIEILNTSIHPTFVCPGNHDRQALHYERAFGPQVYMFRFGADGYLAFDSKDFVTANELGPQDASLQIFRRAIKPARWSIGFTHRFEPDQGLRSQIILFVDNPLDLLVFGHWHRENGPGQERVPWGTTPMIVTPAARDGAYRLIDVGPLEISPREVQHVRIVQDSTTP